MKASELYNEDDDPHELNNLVADPEYKDVVTRLDSMLHAVHPRIVQGGVAEPNTREIFSN